MPRFDKKTWNDSIYQKYTQKVPNTKLNYLIKSKVIQERPELKNTLVDGVGGNQIVEPIKGNIGGKSVNYDGKTKITTDSRNTFAQRKIVIGRAKGFAEKDFSTDISGEDYMPVAAEVEEYFQGEYMDSLLAMLKGVFSIAKDGSYDFASANTYEENGEINATTINNAAHKAFGDNKKIVKMAFMHSDVAKTLENLQILDYLKYTDANGIQSNLEIAQQGNKIVIVDDAMPMETGYYLATAETPNALKVTAAGSGPNEITQANVKKGDFYPDKLTNDTTYVVAGNRYTTYLLGEGAIEYCDIGAKVPSEVDRDPETDGGIDKLYARKRKLYAPKYISWKGSNSIISPTNEELATGTNWEVVNDSESEKEYIPTKVIPIARIYTRG